MATLDLTNTTDADGFVIYFGGQPNEVDAYTFANALVAVADAFREISSQTNPGLALELRIEALAEGSFKARLRASSKSLKSLFSGISKQVILPLFLAFLYDEMKGKEQIIVNADEVVIERGKDRIIIPRKAYDAAKSLPNKAAVRSHIAKAMAVVSADENVESFGIYRDFDPKAPPLISIPRSDFDRVKEIEEVDDHTRRHRDESATLHVLKAVFQASSRKWEFVWNGVKISAPIDDPVFLTDLLQRRYLIGNGDALEVTLKISQRWDSTSSVWLNDGYSVTKVWDHIPANPPKQFGLLDDDPS
jgi:hypothetical protein